MHGEAGGLHGHHPPCGFETGSLNWSLPTRLEWLPGEPHESACLGLLNTEIAKFAPLTLGFLSVVLGVAC